MGIRTGLIGITSVLALVSMPASSAVEADTATPTLISFRVNDRTVGAGDVLAIDYAFTDDTSSALSFVDFEFRDGDGQTRPVFAYAQPLAGHLELIVPGDWPAGAYTLESVYGADVSLNLIEYHRDGQTSITPATAVGPSSHTFDLAAADLSVEARAPDPPTRVNAHAGDASAKVLWRAAPANGSPLTEYVVSVTPGDRSVTVPATATSAHVDGLVNGTTYTFVVRATNAIGTSPDSLPSQSVTPATRPARVARPKVTVKRQRIVVTWRAPQDGGSPLTGYRVTLAGDTTRLPARRHALSQRLKPGRYRVFVAATNTLGTGRASPVVTFRMRKGHWSNH
jgi:Fibronectin type III domain